MPVSNTYVEPTANMSLNFARAVYNESMRAILTNFKSPATPGATNLNIDGVGVTPSAVDGMLYRSPVTNALYIADTLNYKGGPTGGIFTRWGIGHRVEPTVASLANAISTYEIGELVATLDTGKLYLRNSNTASIASFVDVGAPQGFTVQGGTSNATFVGQSVTGLKINAISNISVGTSSPTQSLDVRGGALITGTLTSNIVVANTFNVPATAYFGPSWTNSPMFHIRARSYTDQSSAPGATIGARTSVSFFRPTFDSSNGTVFITNASTLFLAGSPIAGPNTSITNSHVIHADNGGIYLSAWGSLANPAIAIGAPNNGILAASTTSIATVCGGVLVNQSYQTGDFVAVGNVTAYSDKRLKTNIRTIDSALDKVSAMRGVYFTKDGRKSTGVVAQEIEEVLPEVVIDGEYKSVAYGNIVGVLIEAIKELQAKVAKLEGGV